MEGGVDGESCTQSENDTALWCEHFLSPMCVDRTIRCAAPPLPPNTNITFIVAPNPDDYSEVNTTIHYFCPEDKHYFNYPVGPDFVSYYYSTNLNDIKMTCNNDG